MRRLWRVLSAAWALCGWGLLLGCGYWIGHDIGFGRGARAIAEVIHEMRQGAYETPEPWDRGEI